jgi:hypothetical protein
MSEDRVRRCLEQGTTILVASVNRQGVPSCCRGVALTSNDDLATATVYVPLAASQDTIANVATTHRIAVSITHPVDHSSIQLKGTTATTRLAEDREAGFVRGRLDAMAEVLDSIGLPRRIVHSITCWPSYAIDVRVEEIYDQTPGPNAGSRLR